MLGEALARDSISQGNAVPQLSAAELSLLQEAHPANAAAQAAAAAVAGAVSFAGRAMSSLSAARPPRS